MASSSAAAGGSGQPDDDFGRVYRAVATGESAEEVRRVLEAVARGSAEQRAAAANTAGRRESGQEETPLQAAQRLGRGDLVGALVEAGADVKELFDAVVATPLAACVAYGQVDSVRALLRAGGHDPNEKVFVRADGVPPGTFCTAMHLCIDPSHFLFFPFWISTMPQLACLEALVREGRGDVNARDSLGRSPMHWIYGLFNVPRTSALDALLGLGADLEARDDRGRTPLFPCAQRNDLAALLDLLERGADADVIDDDGGTPLTTACMHGGPDAKEVIWELLGLSSPDTLRSLWRPREEGGEADGGTSAADALVFSIFADAKNNPAAPIPLWPWQLGVLREMLLSGAPISAYCVDLLMPYAAIDSDLRQEELAERRSEARRWRGHDAMVGLALDAREAQEAEDAVEAARARVEALEERVRGSESEEEEEEEASDESGSEGEGGRG